MEIQMGTGRLSFQNIIPFTKTCILVAGWALSPGCGSQGGVKTEQKVKQDRESYITYTPGAKIEVTSDKDQDAYQSQGTSNPPLMLIDASRVCDDVTFYNGEGELLQGTRDCGDSTQLKAENIRDGITIAGVKGTLVDIHDIPELIPDNIRSGVSIAGITGTFIASPPACTNEGSQHCVSSSAFTPALTAGLGDKVIAGSSVAAVSGNIVLPAPGKVWSGHSYGANGTAQRGSLILPSPSHVLAGTGQYGDSSNLLTPGYTPDFPNVANVRAQDTVNGVSGTLGNCSADGGTGCVTIDSYKSADATRISAGNIRNGVTIAGQAGGYPSSSYRLPFASNTDDLDNPTFLLKLKSSGNFEYWSSDGSYQTGTGDAELSAENILKDVDIFGTAGTLSPLPCSYTDEAACTADSVCRWRGAACQLNPWNIRSGISLAGTVGSMKQSCRNRIASSIFNTDSMPPQDQATNGTLFDWWDTTDNQYSTGLVTAEQPTGWTSEHSCGKELWTDVTPDGTCDSSADDCMMRDNISTLIWSESFPVSESAPTNTTGNWSVAVAHCNDLSFGERSDWRLPTQMELQAAYIHGLTELAYRGGTARPGGDALDNNNFFIAQTGAYWSATTHSLTTTTAYNMHLGQSYSNAPTKTTAFAILCVAP
jgi:hypothetical protein